MKMFLEYNDANVCVTQAAYDDDWSVVGTVLGMVGQDGVFAPGPAGKWAMWPRAELDGLPRVGETFDPANPTAAPTGGDEPAPLADAIAQRLTELGERRAKAILDFTYDGHAIPLTAATQSDIGNAVAGLKQSPDGTLIQWEIAHGVYTPMDLAGVTALGMAAFVHVQACYANSQALAAMIMAATTPANVAVVNIDGGWPVWRAPAVLIL